MPIAIVPCAGRCFGWQPAAKVSMMIMRPPQQRQGRGSTRGSSVAAGSPAGLKGRSAATGRTDQCDRIARMTAVGPKLLPLITG
jgi:hypothetical protein